MIESTRALGTYPGDIFYSTHPPVRSTVIRLATAYLLRFTPHSSRI